MTYVILITRRMIYMNKTNSQVADALIIYLEIKANIDRALVSGNKELFMNLTESLNELTDMGVFA